MTGSVGRGNIALTPRQVIWLQCVFRGVNGTDAVRIAYPENRNPKDKGLKLRNSVTLRRLLEKYRDKIWFNEVPEVILDSVNEGLLATKWVKVRVEERMTDLEVPDHPARGRARDQILKFKEIYDVSESTEAPPDDDEKDEGPPPDDYWLLRFRQENDRSPANEGEMIEFKEKHREEVQELAQISGGNIA